MKKIIFTLTAAVLLLASCAKNEADMPQAVADKGQTVTVSVPVEKTGTRTTLEQETGTKNIIVRWKAGDVINLYFVQGTAVTAVENVALTDFSNGDKTAKFAIPATVEGINLAETYHLYGLHGTAATVANGKILADVSPKPAGLLTGYNVPMMFKAEIAAGGNVSPVTFEHLGALQVVTLRNYAVVDVAFTGFSLVPADGSAPAWMHVATTTEAPVYDLIAGTVETAAAATPATVQTLTVGAGQSAQVAVWVMPTAAAAPEVKLNMVKSDASALLSIGAKPARTEPLQKGNAYHLEAWHDGSVLRLRPKLALEYVAEYNVNVAGTGFTTSQTNGVENGYFTWEQAVNLFTADNLNTNAPALKGYHLPTKEECAGILPLYTQNHPYYMQNTTTSNAAEIISVGGEQKTYSAEYKNMGTMDKRITYALRYKGNGNTRLSAWRYSYETAVIADGGGNKLVIQEIYLGPSFSGTLDDIATETYWSNYTTDKVTRTFPSCGYFTPDSEVHGRAGVGFYWSSAEDNDANALSMFFDHYYAVTFGGTSQTYEYAVRPFSDK